MWIGLAVCSALGLAALVLATLGAGERGTYVALQATARLSFLLFWPAYVGGPLTALLGSDHRLPNRVRIVSALLMHRGLPARAGLAGPHIAGHGAGLATS
jgi:hypothetical protein